MPRLPALRRLAASLTGSDAFLRAAAGIEVFAERGLLSLLRTEESLSLHPIPGRRANLEQSIHVMRLRQIMEQNMKGGR